MKIVLIIAAVVVAIVVLVIMIGASLPKKHTASRSIVVKSDRMTTYNAIRDVASAPRWRANVTKVELIDANHFREFAKHGSVTYAIDADDPGHRLITRITDDNLGYSGSWTYDLADAPGGTRVTITENGEVTNVVFRFMSRFVFGHTATIDAYLAALQKHM